MPASAPETLNPVTVSALFAPTFLSAYEAEPVPPSVTTSEPSFPESAGVPVSAALVVVSYTLSTPAKPLTLSGADVMFAVSPLGWANE